jgi:DNA-binding response OmpR family regulator
MKSTAAGVSVENAEAGHRRKLRILLVDADPRYLEPHRRYLEQQGYEVLIATDGRSAIETTGRSAPDLIVLAMVLPDMDGLHVLEALRAEEEAQPTAVIVLSSNTERRLVERSRELGVLDYLSKQSTDPATLLTCVSGLLRTRRVAPLS